ncbi:MAG: PDZ domain-containing protein [bacterium]|nr:PDZ domain-containing protein [bacterium]
MNRTLLLLVLAGTTVLMQPGWAVAEDALNQLQERIIDVNMRVSPSVVHVEAAIRVNNRRKLVTGSGFITGRSGVVLTNRHVVDRAEKVSVVVPGREGRYEAEVVGTDKQTDVAVLRISPRDGEDEFPAAAIGDSESLRVGEWVIAIGNPYGLQGTVSLGIVSAKGRDLSGSQMLNDFIQTDAMIDHGSSGGPLINLKGEVVGINSRGQGRGIGFTIPINTARRVEEDLLALGSIARGYLGVTIQPFPRELARYWDQPSVHGVLVGSVVRGSPAEAAGVHVGDIIQTIDGEELRAEKPDDLGLFQRMVAQMDVGKEVQVGIFRDEKVQMLNAKLTAQPKVVPDEEETEHGFTVQEVTESLFRSHRLSMRQGVLVSFVEGGSEAAEASMNQGDLVVQIEDLEIKGLDDFREAVSKLSNQPFLVRALRGDDLRFMLIVPRSKDAPAAPSADPNS